MTSNKQIKLYRFNRKKYGVDLRCDAFTFDHILPGIKANPTHRESFYCFILVEKGKCKVRVGGRGAEVGPNTLICGLPGELWEWQDDPEIEGKVVIFEPDFLLSAIKDTLLLQRPGFLRTDEHNPFISLSDKGLAWIRDIIIEMIEEMESPTRFIDLLQAQLWHLILLIEKDYQQNGNHLSAMSAANYASAFINLIGAEVHRHHDVEYYASRLCITPNYLNKICRNNLGVSSIEYIQQRILSEAKNLLKVTDMSVKEVASALGYDNNSYFVRLFRSKTGVTPGEFRNQAK